MGRHQGWKEVNELYSSKGYTPRATQSLLSQMKVIEGGKLTEMEREEVRRKVTEELKGMFGDSVDETFEGFDEVDMTDATDTIDFAIVGENEDGNGEGNDQGNDDDDRWGAG